MDARPQSSSSGSGGGGSRKKSSGGRGHFSSQRRGGRGGNNRGRGSQNQRQQQQQERQQNSPPIVPGGAQQRETTRGPPLRSSGTPSERDGHYEHNKRLQSTADSNTFSFGANNAIEEPSKATDCMTELTTQMQLIQTTIGNSLTQTNPNHHHHQCTNCNNHTTTMKELQSQLQLAMKRVNKMATTLTVLQTHAGLVQKSLETLSAVVVQGHDDDSVVAVPSSSPDVGVYNNGALLKDDGSLMVVEQTINNRGGRTNVGNNQSMMAATAASVVPPTQVPPLPKVSNGGRSSQILPPPQVSSPQQSNTVTANGQRDDGSEKKSYNNPTARKPWKCDFCPTSFNDYDAAVEHENQCKQNPNVQQSSSNGVHMKANNNEDRVLPSSVPTATSKKSASQEKLLSKLRHQKIDTLDKLILKCSSCINGSPHKYTSWLRKELDVNSIADLAEAITDCPESLVEGGVFNISFLAEVVAVCTGQQQEEQQQQPAPKEVSSVDVEGGDSLQQGMGGTNEVERINVVVTTSSSGAENSADIGANNKSEYWTCPVCTLSNPKIFLACDACGSTAGRSTMSTGRTDVVGQHASNHAVVKKSEVQQAEEKKRQEEKARKKHEKAERKKAELARKKEEERVAAEAEKQRQLEAKLEKQAVMARYEADTQQHQRGKIQGNGYGAEQKREVSKRTLNADSAPFMPISTSEKPSSSLQMTAKRRGASLPSGKAKKTVTVDQLSYYIKSKKRKGDTNASPIFDLLQDKSTVEEGRRLLILEADTYTCKEEHNDLVAQRSRLEKGIQAEENNIKKSEDEIAELERKTTSKWAVSMKNMFGGKNVEKALEEEDKHIDEELAKQLAALKSARIDGNESELSSLLSMDIPAEDAPATLEELIFKCSSFLTCSPSEYVLWLHSEGIKTINDLGIGVISEVEKFVKGDGNVGISSESEDVFTATVLKAMSAGDSANKSTLPQRKELTKEEKEKLEKREREKRAKKMVQKAEERKFNRQKAVKEARKRIEHLNKVIKSSKTSIKSQKGQLTDLQNPLLIKSKQLQKLREDISYVKGTGIEEDINFHIDRSKDDRGFTFLMIAAQNDDLFTAKICFELGADAYAKSPEGLTAIDFSFFFEHKRVTNLILQNGGSLPQKQSEAWNSLQSMTPLSADSSRSWDDALKVAESAALPAETLMESPEKCETDEDKRMNILTSQESSNMDFSCFESRLIDSNINPDQVQRVALLEQKVYNWCMSADPTTRSNFIDVLEGLKPPSVRRPGVNATKIHRRAMVGTTTTFEVLASRFEDISKEKDAERDQVVLFSPFVSGEVEGVTSIGILAWAVAPDSEASLYKTLVANTEFMRHKVTMDDRFLEHREGVLQLGKDMHLLDLQSTSIWTTATMDLHILNVDHGDLTSISRPGFSAKKRIVHSEELINKAIFRSSQAEANENEGILASGRLDMSSLVSGGAGTGKTLLIIRKVASEEPSRRVLVVTRLPRLVNVIKTAVEEKRDDGVENLSFTTYDDLVQLLARRVVPDDDSHYESFVQFDRIRFDCDDSNISFSREFINDFLNSKERKEMKSHEIEPLTLWHAIIVIKSNSNCARTKQPLSLDDYITLPISFGLTQTQRKLCYDLFLKYEEWRHNGHYWDEMDRVLYVMTHGPSVFRDDKFIPWAARVNRFGEMDLLDDEGTPLYPFFYDVVCADEAQDFTEIDLLLFTKMSASIRSLFLSADVAQSVEVGVNMRATTVNDVFHSLVKNGKHQVKDVLQYIDLLKNHRTHAQNLAIGQAVRSILARSFQIPMTRESALIKGDLPKTMMMKKIRDLADASIFQGGNIVFVAPDEKVHELRLQFQALEIHNDVFGVREAKGLEFDACALLGFFGHFEELGSKDEWQNVLRWLSSSSTTTKTSSTGEKVDGLMLTDCDYRLSAPNVSDEAMMLYTALTRARNHLYLIELEGAGKGKKQGKPLAQFAFRRLKDLGLAKPVSFIKEGHVEMTPAEHKARGVLYVTQALNMSRNMAPFSNVKGKFMEAMSRFAPEKGNDKDLLDKCEKHLDALTKMHSLMKFAKESFLRGGAYNLEGRFAEVLEFEQMASEFFSQFLCDSFLVTEIHAVRLLIEEVVDGTPYETHFKSICATVKELEQAI